MKIPSVTQATPPTTTVLPPASAPDEAPTPARPVIERPGEDGATISIVAPPAALLDRLQAKAATATDGGTATADDLTRQLAAEQQSPQTDVARGETIPDAAPSRPNAAAAGSPPADLPTVDDRQPFKVVLGLKPVKGNRWHATIGVGRDGCDPCWEGSDVDDWPEALDSVLGLYAAAEARWAAQPRNPRPAAAPTAPRPVATAGASSSPSTKTNGNAGKAKVAGTGNGALPPLTTAAVSAPTPVPATDPAPAAGVEKLTLF